MWKTNREFVCFALIAMFATATLVSAAVNKDQECDQSDLDQRCPNEGETCAIDESTRKAMCICIINYVRDPSGLKCVKKPPTRPPLPETTTEKLDAASSSYGSSVAAGLLIPTFLIGLGVLGFCFARRYRLLPCRRNLYGNVLVTRDDDDDDPPIA
ncbi:uncharacterized protein [Venturia canescens]|uniref:uncharacterized protein isoform X2 n=1 Tax=Venturia canescens TaxID=32260 RepID=UPI001C9BC62A|nr:uncharacterized protein LOC122413114 isoform X2 [Venturia canescens]